MFQLRNRKTIFNYALYYLVTDCPGLYEMLTCMYKTGPPPKKKQKNKKNTNTKQLKKTTPVASLMPPPDEIHRGGEIVVNTDINGRVSKKLSQAI